MKHPRDNHIDRRRPVGMDHVDYRINEIEAEVVGLKVAVSAIDEKIDRQTQVITDLVRGGQTNPATQIAFVTLLLGLIIFYNKLTINPVEQSIEFNRQVAAREAELVSKTVETKLDATRSEQEKLREWQKMHANKPSHTGSIHHVKDLEARVKVLEDRSNHVPATK